MFTFVEIAELGDIPNISVTADNYNPMEVKPYEPVWKFADEAHTAFYESCIAENRLLHTAIMMNSITLEYNTAIITVSLPQVKHTATVIPVKPATADEVQENDEYMMKHVMNVNMALRRNGMNLKPENRMVKVRPCGKRKPMDTVSRDGSVYNISEWKFNDEKFSFRNRDGMSVVTATEKVTCHNRRVIDLNTIARRFFLVKDETGAILEAVEQTAKHCDVCDKVYIVNRNIPLTIKTLPLFDELVPLYDYLMKHNLPLGKIKGL